MLVWKESEGQYSAGNNGFLGKWKCFHVEYDSMLSRDHKGPRYKLYAFLPGLKCTLGHFETYELAYQHAEEALSHWIEKAGIGKQNDAFQEK